MGGYLNKVVGEGEEVGVGVRDGTGSISDVAHGVGKVSSHGAEEVTSR